jgi:peptide/nickel transport system permease protein
MGQYILKRILITIPTLLGVTVIIFSLIYLTPGDPARLILGDMASEEDVQILREELGLNKSFPEQYIHYMKGLLHGDMGTSYTSGRPVSTEIFERLPITTLLAFLCMVLAVFAGISAGIISAVRQYSFLDNIIRFFSLLGISMPSFWLALLLMIFFSVILRWLPASGLYSPRYFIMPVLSISAVSIATIARMTRSAMLEVVRQDYIRTVRAKGQKKTVIILRHALKNALVPVITVIGIQFAGILSGTVVNEQIFAIPGLGRLMVDAIKARNYPVVQGGVLVITFMFSVLNFLIDMLYAMVDPKIRTQYTASHFVSGKSSKKEYRANG